MLRLLIGMFGLGVMAASVPGVTETILHGGDKAQAVTAFTIAYVATRIYGAQSWRKGEVLLDFPVAQHTIGVVPWIVSLWTEPHLTVALWVLGVALDLWLVLVLSGDDMLEHYTSRLAQLADREKRSARAAEESALGAEGGERSGRGERRGRARRLLEPVAVVTDPGHLEERLGLFVIIVLGRESSRSSTLPPTPLPRPGSSRPAWSPSCSWPGSSGSLSSTASPGCPTCAAVPWAPASGLALHCLFTGTIATVAVGLAAVVEHGHEPLDGPTRWLLCGAVAVYFLLAQVVAFFVYGKAAVRTLWISSGAVVALVVGFAGGSWPATVVAGLLALVVIAQVVAEVREEQADQT